MALGRPKVALIVTDDERVQLESLAHRSRTAPQLARRARILLACADGLDNTVVAKRLRMSQTTVANGAADLSARDWMGWMTNRARGRHGRSAMRRSSR
jgi:hypothetical protein